MTVPERKKKVPAPDGNGMADGTELGFQTGGEHWNEYLVDDGSVLRIKLVVTDVARVEGHYDPEGNPIYYVSSTNVLTVSARPELKKGGDEE
jgi:hypothetical protein